MPEESLMSVEGKAHAEGVFQGKMLAFLDQWKDFNASWVSHIAADEKNFKEVRDEIAAMKVTMNDCASREEVQKIRESMSRYAGFIAFGSAILGAIATALLPILINQVIK